MTVPQQGFHSHETDIPKDTDDSAAKTIELFSKTQDSGCADAVSEPGKLFDRANLDSNSRIL